MDGQHPTQLELADFMLGDGDGAVERHVESCGKCQRAVATLAGLRDEHHSAYGLPGEIPPSIRERLPTTQPKRTRLLARWRRIAVRIAAAALLVAGAGYWLAWPEAQSIQNPAADVNRDGRVDVLDGLILARQVVSSPSAPAAGDVDRNGSVDVRDVSKLMQTVVAMR